MPKRKNTNPPFPIFLFVGGGIALIAAAFLLFSQNNNDAPQATIVEEIPYPEITRVSLDEAKSALDSGSAILIDVRSAEAYAAQHVAGAINIPAAEIQNRISELDPNEWIIPYCT